MSELARAGLMSERVVTGLIAERASAGPVSGRASAGPVSGRAGAGLITERAGAELINERAGAGLVSERAGAGLKSERAGVSISGHSNGCVCVPPALHGGTLHSTPWLCIWAAIPSIFSLSASIAWPTLTTAPASTRGSTFHSSCFSTALSSICQPPSSVTVSVAGRPDGPIALSPNCSPVVVVALCAHHCSDAYDAAVSDAKPHRLLTSRSATATSMGTNNTGLLCRQYSTVCSSTRIVTACSAHRKL